MSSWDEWPWRRRRWLPFFEPEWFKDTEEVMDRMRKQMEELIKDMDKRVPKDYVRERKLPDGSTIREIGPIVYGYSMTVGPEGKPEIREFGNIKPRMGGPGLGLRGPTIDITEAREPLVDVVSTDGEVKIVAELPGVEKRDIKLHATEATLTISVDKPGRRYRKELQLPEEVDVANAKSTYNNGVLEVTLPKLKRKLKGVSVKVE
ncbi:MAG: archaeal heat shock protein Hsp20 [Candidatus Bathyarchaeia archaeon]